MTAFRGGGATRAAADEADGSDAGGVAEVIARVALSAHRGTRARPTVGVRADGDARSQRGAHCVSVRALGARRRQIAVVAVGDSAEKFAVTRSSVIGVPRRTLGARGICRTTKAVNVFAD